MNETTIESLAPLLRSRAEYIPHETIPSVLLDTPYLTEGELQGTHTCPECGGPAFRTDSPNTEADYLLVCEDIRDHETHYQKEDLLRYNLNKDHLLTAMADLAGLTPTTNLIDELPAFLAQQTEEQVLVCVLGPAKDYEDAVHSAVQRIIDERQPALMFTPRPNIEELHEIIEPYAVAGIIQPLSVLTLTSTEYVQEAATTVQLEQERKQALFDSQGITQDDIRWVLEDHPTLIKSKLSTLKTLRENSNNEEDGIESTIWMDLEKVCKAAFGYLDFEFNPGQGGVDDTGEEVADAVVGFPESATIPTVDELSRLHGIVDVKSGGTAGFDREAVSKQLEYFEGLKGDKLYEPYTFVHLFIVFDVNIEVLLDWYEVAKPHYPAETGLVVMTANALRQMVDLMQSPLALAGVNRSERDTRDVFRYFFDPQLYTQPEFAPIATHPELHEWGADDATTESTFENQQSLLLVTQEMVTQWVQQSFEKEHGTDSLFEVTPSKDP